MPSGRGTFSNRRGGTYTYRRRLAISRPGRPSLSACQRRYRTIVNDPVYQQRSMIVLLSPLMLTLGTFKIRSVARKIDHGYIRKEDQGERGLLPTALADRKLEDGANGGGF